MATTKKNAYCFTINNPTTADEEVLKALEANDKVRYFIIGREKGESGTPHYQGYIYFRSRVVFASVKKVLPRAHIEVARGSVEENFLYCSKDKDFYEHGDRPMSDTEKGKRGREFWVEQLEHCKRGRVEDCDPKLQITHFNALHSVSAYYAAMPLDLDDFDNHWYYGESGSGKSLKARSENPGHYLKMCNKWWDGYRGEDVVIIEDFDKAHKVLGHHMKIWADRYAFPAEVKGSKRNLRPQKIIVTSNWSPQQIWGDEPETLDPILRRFNVVHFIKQLAIAN